MRRRSDRRGGGAETEAQVSARIVEVLARLGWRCYNFASNHALPHGAVGFADIVAFRPASPVLFVQVKRPGGRLTEEQREFASLVCADTGALYLQASSVDDLVALLRDRHLVR